MMIWSRTHTFIAGAALILVANAVALVGVAYNRHGDPESMLLLTQREALLPYSWGFERENSGVTLTLQWRVPSEQGDGPYGLGMSYAGIGGEPGWLDKTKLAALAARIRATPAMKVRVWVHVIMAHHLPAQSSWSCAGGATLRGTERPSAPAPGRKDTSA